MPSCAKPVSLSQELESESMPAADLPALEPGYSKPRARCCQHHALRYDDVSDAELARLPPVCAGGPTIFERIDALPTWQRAAVVFAAVVVVVMAIAFSLDALYQYAADLARAR